MQNQKLGNGAPFPRDMGGRHRRPFIDFAQQNKVMLCTLGITLWGIGVLGVMPKLDPAMPLSALGKKMRYHIVQPRQTHSNNTTATTQQTPPSWCLLIIFLIRFGSIFVQFG